MKGKALIHVHIQGFGGVLTLLFSKINGRENNSRTLVAPRRRSKLLRNCYLKFENFQCSVKSISHKKALDVSGTDVSVLSDYSTS